MPDVIVNYEVPESAEAYQQRWPQNAVKEQLIVTIVSQAETENLRMLVFEATGEQASLSNIHPLDRHSV